MVGRTARAGLWATLFLLVSILASPPAAAPGFVVVEAPASGQGFDAGDAVSVFGLVIDFNGTPLGGVRVDVRLLDAAGTPVPGADRSDLSANDGSWFVTIPIPESAPTGRYAILVDAADVSISDREVPINVRAAFYAPGPAALGVLAVGTASAVAAVLTLLRRTGSRRKA